MKRDHESESALDNRMRRDWSLPRAEDYCIWALDIVNYVNGTPPPSPEIVAATDRVDAALDSEAFGWTDIPLDIQRVVLDLMLERTVHDPAWYTALAMLRRTCTHCHDGVRPNVQMGILVSRPSLSDALAAAQLNRDTTLVDELIKTEVLPYDGVMERLLAKDFESFWNAVGQTMTPAILRDPKVQSRLKVLAKCPGWTAQYRPKSYPRSIYLTCQSKWPLTPIGCGVMIGGDVTALAVFSEVLPQDFDFLPLLVAGAEFDRVEQLNSLWETCCIQRAKHFLQDAAIAADKRGMAWRMAQESLGKNVLQIAAIHGAQRVLTWGMEAKITEVTKELRLDLLLKAINGHHVNIVQALLTNVLDAYGMQKIVKASLESGDIPILDHVKHFIDTEKTQMYSDVTFYYFNAVPTMSADKALIVFKWLEEHGVSPSELDVGQAFLHRKIPLVAWLIPRLGPDVRDELMKYVNHFSGSLSAEEQQAVKDALNKYMY
jgi:hypothetical protein